MKKSVFLLLIMFCVLLCGCSKTDKNSTLDNNKVDTQKNEVVSDNNQLALSDEEAIEIFRNYWLTVSMEFDENEVVEYKDIFPYFALDGCITSDYQGIKHGVVQYYNAQEMSFSIPYNVVDTYLKARFNTVPDKNSISCYNASTECYEFKQSARGWHEDFSISEKTQISEDKYSFTVKIEYPLQPEEKPTYSKLIVELSEWNYKILSYKKIVESN